MLWTTRPPTLNELPSLPTQNQGRTAGGVGNGGAGSVTTNIRAPSRPPPSNQANHFGRAGVEHPAKKIQRILDGRVHSRHDGVVPVPGCPSPRKIRAYQPSVKVRVRSPATSPAGFGDVNQSLALDVAGWTKSRNPGNREVRPADDGTDDVRLDARRIRRKVPPRYFPRTVFDTWNLTPRTDPPRHRRPGRRSAPAAGATLS